MTDGLTDGPIDGLTDIVTYSHVHATKIKVNSDLVEPCLLAASEAADDTFQHTLRVVACSWRVLQLFFIHRC